MTEVREKIDHRRLMAAVIERAVRDVRETHDLPHPVCPARTDGDKEHNARVREEYYLALEVRSWFASDREGLFTFRGICNALDIDPRPILKKLTPVMTIGNELKWRDYEAGTAGYRKSA